MHELIEEPLDLRADPHELLRPDIGDRSLDLLRELEELRDSLHTVRRDAATELAIVADDVLGLPSHLIEHRLLE